MRKEGGAEEEERDERSIKHENKRENTNKKLHYMRERESLTKGSDLFNLN